MKEKIAEAVKLIEVGLHEQGLEKLEKLTKTEDDDGKRTIAEIYFELGLVDRAIPIIEELLFRYPDHGELFAFLAECYLELGNEDEALEMLLEVKEDDPAFVQAQLILADLYQGQGMDEVAEQKLLRAIELTKEEPILLYGLGEFYLSRGDYQKSIPYFKKVLNDKQFLEEHDKLNPHLRIAEAYSATGLFEDALKHYELGIRKKEDVQGLFGYGFTALQLEDYETTIKQLKRLLEIDPDYTTAYSYLAQALRSIRRPEEAIDVLNQGLARDEYNEDLYYEMALAQFQIGNMEEGKNYLEKIIALNPANIRAVKELLHYFYRNDDYDGMLELLQFLDEYDEYDPLFERFKGKALYEMDDLDGAVQAYNNALEQYENDVEFLEEAAFVFLEVGDREKGMKLLKKLVNLAPEREDIVERINELEEQQMF